MAHASVASPTSVAVNAPPAASDELTATIDASIAAYLDSGERMRVALGWLGIACLALMAVVAVAWVVGLLPGAIRFF